MIISEINDWVTGNGQYHTFPQCLNGDYITCAIIILLGVSIATGYIVIALAWRRISMQIKDLAAKRSMNTLMMIFIYCAFCGYLWHPIQYFWPGWRFYIIPLAILSGWTWYFIFDGSSLENIAKYFINKEEMRLDIIRLKKELEDLKK